jgi:hypothetical protein
VENELADESLIATGPVNSDSVLIRRALAYWAVGHALKRIPSVTLSLSPSDQITNEPPKTATVTASAETDGDDNFRCAADSYNGSREVVEQVMREEAGIEFLPFSDVVLTHPGDKKQSVASISQGKEMTVALTMEIDRVLRLSRDILEPLNSAAGLMTYMLYL